MIDLQRVGPGVWEIAPTGQMRVPGRVFAGDELVESVRRDQALQQVVNVASLPGIVEASMAMPDIHWGYGFPIGGVAATDPSEGGVVSPGGVGFDICCGVRLLRSDLEVGEFRAKAGPLMDALADAIPRGTGEGAIADRRLVDDVLVRGAVAVLDAGYGVPGDLERCEEGGTSEGADPSAVSDLARERGSRQLGSLGGGNHFLEVQAVERVDDPEAARVFGLAEGMVCVMIHCGSRGLGHQVCTDQLRVMDRATARYGIGLPDRQLACVPVQSEEGRAYLAAMAAAANFAWANRHVLADATRKAFSSVVGEATGGMELVWDVAHNLAKLERHASASGERILCVHRKGATRAFGPGHPDLPEALAQVGQPVLIPGSMGTASWVMRGVEANPAFASAAHGAGRTMSRKKALSFESGASVRKGLERQGVLMRPGSTRLVAEEAPYAYKDVDQVVSACEEARLAAPVARLLPLGVVKG